MADFVQIDPVTGDFIADMPPDYDGTVTDEVKPGPVPEGFIVPRWTGGDPLWIEGATQEQLDARAAFLADEANLDAADAILAALIDAERPISRDPRAVWAVLRALGKAGYARSLATRDANLASRQAHQAYVAAQGTNLSTALAALNTLSTALGTQDEARRQADIDYLAAIQAIKNAIDAREANGS